jgi:hypothetical protein
MEKTCRYCQQQFEISDADLKFYDRISPVFAGKKYGIPAPTFCHDCRQQRRLAFRNERKLYHRKCDLSGKQIISNYAPESIFPVYEFSTWWSDAWDPKIYGQEFGFQKPFFEQFRLLQEKVPQLALSVWNSENSNYCNYVGNVKNSYLIFGSVYSEDCYYGSPYYSRNCLDTLVVRECESCYECVDCRKLHSCFYCQDCHSSSDLIFSFDLQGCRHCIGCAGLRNKEYHIFNSPFSKDEFFKRKAELNLCSEKNRELLSQKLGSFTRAIPHRFMQSNQVENVSGNYVYESKNIESGYYVDRSQDCHYVAQVVDLKDCYDNNFTEENELCYEYLGAYQVTNTHFSKFCNRVHDAFYCHSCFTSKNLFGCIGMRNAEYCILNKQYTKEGYENLVPRIIEHMEKSQEWGEFFPMKISPFAYNETVAHEYFPLEKGEVLRQNLPWKEEEIIENYLGPKREIPRNIADIDESICNEILRCEATGRPYKIIPQEFKFYKEMNLPIPRRCPDVRHKERMAQRNPRKLWDRECMKCGKDIRTTFSLDRPEIVYCEECYLGAMY